MKSPSLDALYTQIDRCILLTQSYTEVSELFFVIKACRLKPYDYIFEDKTNKLVLYRWWFDEFGNSLHINKQKRVKITYNDLALDRERIICTDLYHGLSMNKVAKMSKLVHVCTGKDEDFFQDCYMLSFLGIDNYLRTYMYLYGEWQQVSPLLLGLKNLRTIGKNADIKLFVELTKKENSPIPCISGRQWLSFMPASSDFINMMEKQYETVSSIFNNKE
jgi:hypothetical protein